MFEGDYCPNCDNYIKELEQKLTDGKEALAIERHVKGELEALVSRPKREMYERINKLEQERTESNKQIYALAEAVRLLGEEVDKKQQELAALKSEPCMCIASQEVGELSAEVQRQRKELAALREAIEQHKSVVSAGPGHDFAEDLELWAALNREGE